MQTLYAYNMKMILEWIVTDDDTMMQSYISNNEGGRRTWNKNTMQHAKCVLQHATYKKLDFECRLP